MTTLLFTSHTLRLIAMLLLLFNTQQCNILVTGFCPSPTLKWTTSAASGGAIMVSSSFSSSSSLLYSSSNPPPPKNTVAPNNSNSDYYSDNKSGRKSNKHIRNQDFIYDKSYEYEYNPYAEYDEYSNDPSKSPLGSKIHNDEYYEAIVLYHKGESPIFVQETSTGQAAFAGYRYNQDQNALRCSTIQNIGDVIVAIDGASTQGSTVTEIIQFIQEKARKNSHSFFRLRTKPKYARGPLHRNEDDDDDEEHGVLPGERHRQQLEVEIAQIKDTISEKEEQVEHLEELKGTLQEEMQQVFEYDLDWIAEQQEALKKLQEESKALLLSSTSSVTGEKKKKRVKTTDPSLQKDSNNNDSESDKDANEQPTSTGTGPKLVGPRTLPPITKPSTTPNASSTGSVPPPPHASVNLPQIDLNRCSTEVQRAINYLYGGTTTTMRRPVQYETLEYLKDVFRKLQEAKRTHISEVSMLQEGASITCENYQEFVTELRGIIDLLVEMRTKEGGDGATEQLQLELFVQCLTRVFAGQGKMKPPVVISPNPNPPSSGPKPSSSSSSSSSSSRTTSSTTKPSTTLPQKQQRRQPYRPNW